MALRTHPFSRSHGYMETMILQMNRCRLFTLITSTVGLLVMLFIFFFSHTPSTVVTIFPQEHQQKVSVILCFVQTSPTQLVAAENNLQKAFSSMKLEHETIVVLPPQSRNIRQKVASLFSSNFRHHHTEIITHQSCSLAFSKAHFSVILLIGANLTSYDSTVSQLVKPVLQGQSDLVIAGNTRQHINLWERFLFFLLLPLLGTTYLPDTLTLSILAPVWTHGCHGVDESRGSFSVELTSHCTLKHLTTVTAELTKVHEHNQVSLKQVVALWWSLHPLVCIIICLCTLLVLVAMVTLRLRKRTKVYNKHII